MWHAGLDLSRQKIEVYLLSESGEQPDQLAAGPDADALRTLARRSRRGPALWRRDVDRRHRYTGTERFGAAVSGGWFGYRRGVPLC